MSMLLTAQTPTWLTLSLHHLLQLSQIHPLFLMTLMETVQLHLLVFNSKLGSTSVITALGGHTVVSDADIAQIV